MHNQMGQYLYVGLSCETDGKYNRERYAEYHNELASNNMDVKKTNKVMLKKLEQDIKDCYGSFTRLLIKKSTSSFAVTGEISWVISSLYEHGDTEKITNLMYRLVTSINETIYIIISIFVLLGSIYNVKYLKNNKLLFVNVALYGCCLMLIFVESQSRYTYALKPMFCILAATGIYYSYDLFKKIFTRKE